MRARSLLVLLLIAAIALVSAPAALADGDPGSDVLVFQPLFLAADSGISIAQQEQLNTLITRSSQAGFKIRVAIIAKSADLGAVTALWGKPREYAQYLGYEISLSYPGRLLVVMPDGLGFNWPKHSATAAYQALAHVPLHSGAAMTQTAVAAIRALAAADHIQLPSSTAGTPATPSSSAAAPASAAAGTPRAHSGAGSTRLLAFLALVLVVLAAVAGRRLIGRRQLRLGPLLGTVRARRLQLGGAAGVVLVGVVALLALPGSSKPAERPWTNPVLDPGTPLSRAAPAFTLVNQFGQQVSLASMRGKVVILAFTDSECTSMCPMSTSAMLDAKAMLGSAGRNVELVGIDANPRATAIDDVLSYSEVHGMLHAWDFLTGNLSVLKQAWKDYSITATISLRAVDHTPAIFVIDPQGKIVREYVTQQSYAAIGQLGELLARESASLLPGHPTVHSQLSYKYIPGIYPTVRVQVPLARGGTTTLGPGKARLLLFFATWDRQVTDLGGGLEGLNRYARLARREGLPPLTAIDEGAVEPKGALAPFLHSVPEALDYPVAVDRTGQIADGYEIEYEPWLMLVSKSGQIAWYYSVSALGWPSTAKLVRSIREGLAYAASHSAASQTQVLKSSSPKLAALQSQGSKLIGSFPGLRSRIRSLRGFPVVVNVWASWCVPCRSEFGLFRSASRQYGDDVAFLGADANDSAANASAFLAQHQVSYPSYSAHLTQIDSIAQVVGVPTTIFINRSGHVSYVHPGQYTTERALDADIRAYTGG